MSKIQIPFYIMTLSFYLLLPQIQASQINVSSITALQTAINNSSSGDTITLADNTYSNNTISITKSNITVKAATPGGVYLNGTNAITISGNYVTFSGFQFTSGSIAGIVITVDGSHNTISQLNFNGYSAQKYILLNNGTQYNEISYCNFQNKPSTAPIGNLIHISPDTLIPGYHKIRYCSFQKMPGAGGDNGNECIRISNGATSTYVSRTVVEYCYFDSTGYGDSEVISVKCRENILRFNTNTNNQKGNFCFRNGNNNIAYGNFFISAGGIRIKEANNIYCYNNYFENCGDGTVTAPVKYVYVSPNLNNINFIHNTFVDGTSIELDNGATSNTWANNIFKKSSGSIFTGSTSGISWAGNIRNGTLGVTISTGMTNVDPLLTMNTDGYYGLSSSSPAINAASASYPSILDIANVDDDPTLAFDLGGQSRPSTVTLKDAGSDEYGATGSVTNHPLILSDVGPSYIGGPSGKTNQTIAFSELPSKVYGNADFAPGASASSGLTVSYSSSNTSVATIVSGNIHIVGAGASTITASQSGDDTYNAAADVQQTLTVSKANQTITFNALQDKTVGSPDFSPGATASSGLTVSYVSSTPSVATIVSGNIHVVGLGTSTITASQAGDSFYNAAADVQQSFSVTTLKQDQTVSFSSLPVKYVGASDFGPGATASSGLTVSYASSNSSVATIVSGNIHIVGAGTSTITASQSGDATYNAASTVQQTLTVVNAIASTATGNWNVGSTWVSGVVPGRTDNVLIQTGHTITGVTGYAFNNLTINGILTLPSSVIDTVRGNVCITGSSSALNFSSNSSKLYNAGSGSTFTLADGGTFQPNTGISNSLTGNSFTWTVDNTVLTTIIYKCQNTFTVDVLPNSQVYGNLKFTTASGSSATVTIARNITVLGNVSWAPSTSAAFTWDFGTYKIIAAGSSDSVIAGNTSYGTPTLTGTGSDLFSGFVSYNFVATKFTVNYALNGSQNIIPAPYKHLTISGGGTKSLTGSVSVDSILTLTAGSLAVGTNTLTLNGPTIAGTPTNLTTTSSSSLVFGGSSAGVNIPSSVTAMNNLTINNTSGVTMNASTISSGLLTIGTGASLNLGSYNPSANQLSLGGSGQLVGTFGSPTSSATNKSAYFGGTGKLTVNTALPVELTSLSSMAIGQNVEIRWTTAGEVNNIGFEIERTECSNYHWTKIGYREGSGTSNTEHKYSYSDQKLKAGIYVYRLKQIDRDGGFTYSQSVEVTIAQPKVFALLQNYPNPFNPSTTVDYSVPVGGNVRISVFNAIGQEIGVLVNELKEPGEYTAEFNASEYSSGVYFYKLQAGTFTALRKMIVLK